MPLLQLPLTTVGSSDLNLVDLTINLALALLLSHLLGWHLQRFGQIQANKAKMARVLVFVTSTTLLIISVVKVSLALSLGLVGALSIIRFRTPIKEPEELAYLFLAIAVGVGLGADRRWETSLVFVVVLVAMAARTAASGRTPLRTVLELGVVGQDAAATALPQLLPVVTAHCKQVDLRRVDQQTESLQASFFVELRDIHQLQALLDAVQAALPGATVAVVERDHLD